MKDKAIRKRSVRKWKDVEDQFDAGILSQDELNYLMSVPPCQQATLMNTVKRLMTDRVESVPRTFRVAMSNLEHRGRIYEQLRHRRNDSKFETWVDAVLSLPVGKYTPRPIDSEDSAHVGAYLNAVRQRMDERIHGQLEAKEEVSCLLCQWLRSESTNAFALALEGPPGIGKTTFARHAIAAALGRPLVFIGLGGASDACFLDGQLYTYEGSTYGRIAAALVEAKCMDPILFFDEVDKIAKGPKGDEIISTLIHLTDKDHNDQYSDKYLFPIRLDVSKATFVFSYNNPGEVNPVLMDRLNVIHMRAPDVGEKVAIAQRHLLPPVLKQFNSSIVIPARLLEVIVREYTNESGVRGLSKCLYRIVAKKTLGECMTGDGTEVDVSFVRRHLTRCAEPVSCAMYS